MPAATEEGRTTVPGRVQRGGGCSGGCGRAGSQWLGGPLDRSGGGG
ncbi:hypothetical protein G443_004767 [Actinoalloteichus cyanogriseus DSM 43889]|uniref:Uncharacterized protein n=1 Tax=Actinoalloteichus caeruleus DSM 43889 TaxID=1120930 RepID=A0ABT1JPQ4_ACTCY|nr:hypothetical protein [Actinoalloteichus caeruleus DSM 43889]